MARVKVSRNMNYGVEGVSSAYALANGQHGNFRIVAETCRQCAQPKCGDPACAKACPTGAIKFYTWEEADKLLW